MRRRTKWLWIILLIPGTLIPATARYRFSYHFSGSAHGRVLIFFPYRAYYQASASAVFLSPTAHSADKNREFFLQEVDSTGLMMRTTGFSGRTLVVLTLHPDMERGIQRGREEWLRFRNSNGYFLRHIQKVRDFQFRLHSNPLNGLRFLRTGDGVVSGTKYSMDVRYRHSPEVLRINFNVYRIMLEVARLYNHSFRPQSEAFFPALNFPCPGGVWISSFLDFSDNFNAIAPLASRFVGSLKKFKQENSFPLTYRLVSAPQGRRGILGTARPETRIWGNFKIRFFNRRIELDSKSGETVRDEIDVFISKKRHGSLQVKATLLRLDP